jgi:serine/threonine protein kinase
MTFSGKYALEDVIGKGTGGTIRRASDPEGNAWAVKIMDDVDDAVMEYSYGRILHHPCLCASKHMYVENGRAYIVMELMDGDLRAIVARSGPLSEKDARVVVDRVARGLEYMHDRGSVHRDVKPSNIMLAREGRFDTAKLGDFGLSEDGVTRKIRGTPGFMAPEIDGGADTSRLGPAIDAYALGVTLRFLLTGDKAGDKNPGKHAADLIRRLVATDPGERPTMSDVLDHPFCSQPSGNPCSHAIQRAFGCM